MKNHKLSRMVTIYPHNQKPENFVFALRFTRFALSLHFHNTESNELQNISNRSQRIYRQFFG